ncbi:MAG: HAMP domain-containing protein, partial [Candidatus Rokubacteria bacterium]|nr:HAMP domain-containing protein [Candidatus Rokubacteria bacterium]
GRMRLRVRHKLVLLATLVILGVSSGFAWLNLALARRAIEEDLQARAIIFAREIAATIGDRRELESGGALNEQILRILDIRRSALQLDVLTFGPREATIVATNRPATRLPFDRRDTDEVRRGRVVSRAIRGPAERYWEVMAPITLEGAVAGAVAVKFSSQRGDELAARIRFWALTLAAISVVAMGALMSVAIRLVVDRPIQRFMGAIRRVANGTASVTVDVTTADEFGVLARHFNEMIARIDRFNEELRARIVEATDELNRRYRQVEQLNSLLFEMQRRLGHAERLALSGRIMAEVAHEVGTPLHSVAGHLELLRRDLPPAIVTDDVARHLTIVETQVARVIEIIARLLDVTRRPPGEPGPVDLERLTRDTAELVRPGLSGAGLSLDVRGEPGLPRVRGRQDQLQQVILNLLTNAIAATPAGGRIEVTTRAVAAGREVEIAVADTGGGVPAADRKRIFEPFFSTKEAGRGTGLGLFISAEIVHEHGGRIEVDSEEGRGSVFRVILPAGGSGA